MSGPSAWKRAKGWPGWALLFVAFVALIAVGASRDSGPRSPEERVEALSKRLACPVCDGESVFESRNNASAAIRDQVKADVDAGALSDDEIVASIERSYGASVLLVPQSSGIEALAWALPVAAFVCALAGLVVVFRRWRAQSLVHATDADRALVEAALAAARDGDVDDEARETDGDDAA